MHVLWIMEGIRRCLERKKARERGRETWQARVPLCFALQNAYLGIYFLSFPEKRKKVEGKKRKALAIGFRSGPLDNRRYQSILSSNNKGEDIYHMQPRAPEDKKKNSNNKKQKRKPPKYS